LKMRDKKEISNEEKYYLASQWQLMWRKFKKHKLASMAVLVLGLFYFLGIFCEFFAPYSDLTDFSYIHSPPSKIHFFDKDKGFQLRPFVYGLKRKIDPETFRRTFTIDKSKRYPIYFFVQGETYKLWDLFNTNLHFFGTKGEPIFLCGTDKLGRDLFSRNLYASRISLSIGLVGVFISFLLGITLGGISGYCGGAADNIIMRMVDLLISLPTLPLWIALSAAVPRNWSVIKTYFAITIILSIFGWCGLARVVRGKFISLRVEDFAMAAKIAGATDARIIAKHLFPSFLSFLIVHLTLAVPYMILGETALSFLGLGMQPPAVSWGTLLQDAQHIRVVAYHPWLLIPGLFIVITVLAFNFLGDGLRDAADPYK